jgi:aldehyde:ferredoxin oxidoreductase
MKGYTGKVLFVDLTSRAWREEAIPDEVYERHLSGIGLAVYLSTRHIPPGADPLGPDNLLGFVSGLLTGTSAFFSGRWLVTAKSPLTGGWGDANCGGNFGPAIKQCGYDAIFFSGAASEPVYLYADGKTVEIRRAAGLWGLDTHETEARLIEESGNPRRARVACIGPAGERLSLISGICNDRGRLAARSGLGAVMGSKKLKAVLLAGSGQVPCADLAQVKRLSQACNAYLPKGEMKIPTWVLPIAGWFLGASPRGLRLDGLSSLPLFRTFGTSGGTTVGLANGDSPVRNWTGSRGRYAWKKLDPKFFNTRDQKRYHCYACPLGCGATQRWPGEQQEQHRPEYETAAGFGPLLLNEDRESIFRLNELVNRAGMDSISAAATVAFALQCFEAGLISEQETGGLRLAWGNTAAIVTLMEQMIARQGFGDLLADGVRVAAQKIGRGSERFAMHAGGQELPMHDPKYDSGYGIHYIADPTPGRHTIGANMTSETLRLWQRVSWVPEIPASYPAAERYAADETKGLHAAGCALAKALIDGAGLCNFGLMMGVDRFPLFEYLDAVTGWHRTPDEYMEIGRRVHTLRQLFNLREGIDPVQVRLPGQVYGEPPLAAGPLKGKRFDVYEMRRQTWQALGWDPDTGRPRPETLERLGLEAM